MTQYCKECGTTIEGEYVYCPECGTAVEIIEESESANAVSTAEEAARARHPDPVGDVPQPVSSQKGSKVSLKAKILITCGLLVVVLIAGAYYWGKYLTDEERLIKQFEQTIAEGQSDKLLNLLSASNEEVKLDQKTVDGIVEYLKSNKEAMFTIVKQLESEAEQLRSGERDSFATDNEAAFLYLNKKDKKRWLIYDEYELKIKRYMIPVHTNFEGARILVDGSEAASVKSIDAPIELGPFLPGRYQMEAVYQGEYTSLTAQESVSLFPLKQYEDTVQLTLEGDYVDVYSNHSMAHIFIDGNDIELAVGDGQRIGPIALDGTNRIYVEVDYPWGKVRSEEYPVDTDVIELQVNGLNDVVKEEVMRTTHDFLKSWMETFEARDASRLRHIHPDRRADFADAVADMVNNGEHYLGKLYRTTFDLDSFRLNQYSQFDYTVTVSAKVDLSEVFYYEAYEVEPIPVDGTNELQYVLEFVDGQWVVSGWTASYSADMARTKVFEG